MKSRKIIISAVLCLFISCGRLRARASEPELKTYKNTESGVTFDYPANDVIREARTPAGRFSNVMVGVPEDGATRWLLIVEPIEMASYPREMFTPEKVPVIVFAANVARFHCDADSSEETVYCPEVKDTRLSQTSYGLKGYVFTLTEAHEHYNADGTSVVRKDTKYPVYAFDVSEGKGVKILLAEPTAWARGDKKRLNAARDIIKTLRITR